MRYMTVKPSEIEPGDILDRGEIVVSVEMPTAPAVIAKVVTQSAPVYMGILADVEVKRP